MSTGTADIPTKKRMGRPPSAIRNVAVKVNRDLIDRVREIAPSRNMNLAQYVSEAVALKLTYDSNASPG